MAGLQRSEMSFRRQGSSGLVWDDKFLSGELKKINTGTDDNKDTDQQEDNRKAATKSSAYKTVNVAPSYDPPSPRVSGCCGMFGKPASSSSSKTQKRKPAGRRR
ncbi:OLC1v1037124C1 [Oldenlandia corymbosa var. corymbosa]|uniref:OLC1v1037124C1 n=1 Tax=Oldenlandia corymbosa var. corymbosa TaxID=529605 RepID=A0AAV1D033_OLDCO|nr:OLC1v1037124C1 [Oldenlandia corymbosa var. corymbosa]